MWQRYLCWVLGHKTMLKAFTGNIIVNNGVEDMLFKWERSKYCVRCGTEVWKD